MSILSEIFAHRGNPTVYTNTLSWRFITDGATVVEYLSVEPNPATHRQNYYYNTRINVLFKKVLAKGPKSDQYIWKKISS